MIVVKNAAYTIEGGTAGLKYFPFFQKKADEPASVPAERLGGEGGEGRKKKKIKKKSGFSCLCIKGGMEKEEEKKKGIFI